MKRYVLDTNLFVHASHDRSKADELSAFSSAFLPHIHLHAVVVEELLAGATSARWRREIERGLVAPFERRGRVVTPSYRSWKRSGEIVSELITRKKLSPAGVGRSFLNDALLAASCREEGLVLISENERDFDLITSVEPTRVVPPWPDA